MKVVIASYDFPPALGGVATTEAILARAFVKAGHAVTVATLVPGPQEMDGVRVARRPGPWRLFRLFREADLLIVSNLALSLTYPLLVLQRPFALRHHSESAFRLSRSLVSPDLLRRLMLRRARHFMTSRYVGRQSGLRQWVAVHPFADQDNVGPTVSWPVEDRRNLLFAGRLEPEKGIIWLLDHWPHIKGLLGVGGLDIVGDGSMAFHVRDRLAAENTRDVTYHGPLTRAETARRMGQAAYLIVPSLWAEPFGAVALEGLAAGALVLLSDRGGLPEAGGDLGFYFDPDDRPSLEAAIERAVRQRSDQLASTEARQEYRRRLEEHLARFDPRHAVQAIIRGVAERPGPAATS